ncbi:HAMP domain-containing sensor histidine kinase [Synechocystis sp. LKSZ1]|uniref:sensor histidine kinase n=1 Tax=Synechocystis sp. LKSZ1 TaxID=3144951 RepID=UPI00336C2F83
MFQATRRRLALWYTLVTAVLLLLFASGVYFYVRHTLVERIDDTLKHVVEVIDRSLVIQPLSQGHYRLNVEASFRSNAEAVEDDHIDLEWFNPQGQLLWSTLGDSSPITLPLGPKLEKIGFSNDRLLRQITERIERNQHILGYLRVSHPWFEVTKPIQQLLFDLSLGLSLLVGSVGAIGWFLSGLAMEPIKESYQSLKQFTADASHELRNPIAVIQTNVQMALAYPDGDTQQQLKVIERLTQRLGNLVNDLLFLARSDSGTLQSQMQPVPLDALLLEVMEEQRLGATGQSVQLSLEIPSACQEPEAEFTVMGDWDQLARLFTNLISNALEHGLETSTLESRIRLTLKRLQRERQPYLQVVVADNGRGIAPDQLAHLFDRFYRADPARSSLANKGMGLGLAIAQAIAHHHQGQISVKSDVGQGTQFTVLLPCARPPD